MGMHIDRIYKSRLQAMVSVVQQWLSPNGKTKDLVVVWSVSLDVSAFSVWCWSPREVLERCQFSACTGILKKTVLTQEKKQLRMRGSKGFLLPCPSK